MDTHPHAYTRFYLEGKMSTWGTYFKLLFKEIIFAILQKGFLSNLEVWLRLLLTQKTFIL